MAVPPLFVENYDKLVSQLRLGGVEQKDSTEVIERSVLNVRVLLYQNLGDTLVQEILTTPTTEAPTTPDELRRTRAELLERKWCRLLLLREMPVLFMDASGNQRMNWNEDGFSRSISDLNDLIDALEKSINDDLIEIGAPNVTEPVQGGSIDPCSPSYAGTSLGIYAGKNAQYGPGISDCDC